MVTPSTSRFGLRLRGTVLLTACAMILSLFGLAGPATAAVVTASISGTVTGPGGVPVASASVDAYDPATGSSGGAMTAADGTYTIAALPAGSYQVAFRASNVQNLLLQYWQGSTAAGAGLVVVGPGTVAANIDASLVTGGSMTGTVTLPAASSMYCVTATSVGSAPLPEGAGGCFMTPGYLLGGLSTGDYVVSFTAISSIPVYYPAAVSPAGATPVHVVQGALTSSIDASLVPTGSLAAVITSTASPTNPQVGQLVTIHVSVTGGGPTPTGTVRVSSFEGPIGDVVLVAGAGSITTTFTRAEPAGGIEATYSGDATYAAGFAQSSLAVTAVPVVPVPVVPLPVVTALSPAFGATKGGTVVTLTGTGFTGATQVLFGVFPAAAITVVSDTVIRATSPAHLVGLAAVSVVSPAGTSTNAAATFDYRVGSREVDVRGHIRHEHRDRFERSPEVGGSGRAAGHR